MSKHYSKKMFLRCGDDRYTVLGHDYVIGLDAIIKDAQADVRFEPGGGFGASLEFVLPETKAAWAHRLKLAPELGIEEVILVDHLDCGAFAAAYGEMTLEAEEAKHLETLAAAREMVEAAGLRFTGYLQDGRNFRRI